MKNISKNRNAFFKYEILETYQAGIQLKGNEIKSISINGIILDEAFVIFRKQEAYLINAYVGAYQKQIIDYDTRRERKLLLNKDEITKISTIMQQQKLVCVPLRCYFIHALLKMEIGLGKPKKLHDKRETLKKRDLEREIQQKHKKL